MPLSASVMYRLCAAAAFVSITCFTTAYAADARNVEAAPLAAGPFPVACSDVAYDVDRMNQIGGTPADFWEGNPQNGQPRYFTDILLEPQDTIQINPTVPDDSGFYGQTWNMPVPFVVIVCYPTSLGNNRPDYQLPESLVVPKMQRAGQKPIFPPLVPGPIPPGQYDPNLLPLLVFSHGLAASPLNGNTLDVMNRLASFGYIVAAPFHGDARFSQIRVGNIGDLLSVLYNFDEFVEMEALRPLSLKATVDAILAHPDFGPRINPNKIGGFGASMGGASMTWLLGASVTDGITSQNTHPTVRDLRIKAAVGYVPYAGEDFLPAFGEDNATARNVGTPYLAICGTADEVAPISRMEQAMNQFQNSRYLVALTGVQHGYDSSYAGDIFGWAIPFLDAYVKGDLSALANFVQQKKILGGLDDNVTIDYTTPTSGTGVPFTLNYSDSWWNAGESGWGITITDHDTNAFVQWHTYDQYGHNQKYIIPGGTFSSGKCQFSGTIQHATGPSWTLPVFDIYQVARRVAGAATIDFCPAGLPSGTIVFNYTADCVTGSKQLTRLPFGNDAPHWGGGANTGAADFTDLWWNPFESGWGVSVTQHGSNIFFRIFVYDTDGRPLLFVASGTPSSNATSFSGALTLTTGPWFGSDPFDPSRVVRTTTPGNTATLTFSDANNGVLSYTVNGVTKTKLITRLVF